MLKGHEKFTDNIVIATIVAVILISYRCLHWFLTRVYPDLTTLRPFMFYLPLILLFSLTVMGALMARQFSIASYLSTRTSMIRNFYYGYLGGTLICLSALYILKETSMSRFFLIAGAIIGFVLNLLWLSYGYKAYRVLRTKNVNIRHVILIGTQESVLKIAEMIDKNHQIGLRIAGVMSIDNEAIPVRQYPYLGKADAIGKVHDQTVVDYVILTSYKSDPAVVEKVIDECCVRGIEVWFQPDFMGQMAARSKMDYLYGVPLVILSMSPQFRLSLLIKRVSDIVSAGFLLCLLAAPMLVIALSVKLTSKGPVFYAHKRVGLNGRHFVMYKFRSMYSGAKQLTDAEMKQNIMTGPVFKLTRDPRVTPLGFYLRKYSLDELPQLFNVLKGEMSLIGPRPPIPSEVNMYKGWHRRRLSMRPGISGLWQVSGRNSITDFDEWTRLDLKYIDEWSLVLDIKITLKTIPAIIKGTGY